MENMLYILWLHLLPGIGPCLTRNLLSYFTTAEQIYKSTIAELIQVPHIGPSTAQKIFENKHLDEAKYILDYCLKHSIHLISLQNPIYPQRLHLYPQSPTLLYVKGNLDPLNSPSPTTIVGARRCNNYGKEATLELAIKLSKEGIPIISGMAKGIDSYAHTATLQAHGYTAAIVGTGLDRCYPLEHASLMEQITLNGAVISQFPPFVNVHKQNFIKRNELMAMLSESIYVMQASKTSGALYTAEYGFKLNKPVFVLPGNIYDPLHEGSNLLLSKGAQIYIPVPSTSSTTFTSMLSPIGTKLCHLLQSTPLPIDTLQAQLHLATNPFEELLLELELQNIIYQAGGLIHLNRVNIRTINPHR